MRFEMKAENLVDGFELEAEQTWLLAVMRASGWGGRTELGVAAKEEE